MDRFRELVPANLRDNLAFAVVTAGGCYVVLKVTGTLVGAVSTWRVKSRWRNTKKDVVVLHRLPPALHCPNASPFVLKLETYLRMADIPYEVDMGDAMSPDKKKTPWMTLNGEHISDSQLCIEYLAKKFEKKIGKYSEDERAVGTMARIMMDEHFYWGLLMWRYVYGIKKGYGPEKVFVVPKLLIKLLVPVMTSKVNQAAWCQGMGRHSEEDIVKMTSDDLRALSKILGNKKFILGNEPVEDDCAIFGEVAQALWCMPGSPYEKLLNEELTNLRDYCLRMKSTYWPDWDEKIGVIKSS